ncbi:MAG: ribosomal protein [Candidatus Saccharibacteria bacterium]|nr:ribosomal protein [Candidatus Saccharibacteria bacterium]
MPSVIEIITNRQKKHQVVDVKSGDTVRVHQKIREGAKERIQIFEGLVIRTDRKGSLSSSITVRRISSGVGVEKSYLLHSPLVMKIEVTKRSKVRRNYLTYMRARSGKSARLSGQDFDKGAVNTIEEDPAIAAAEAELKATQEAEHAAEMAAKAETEAAEEAKAQEALAAHDAAKA